MSSNNNTSLSAWAEGYGTLSTNSTPPPARFSNTQGQQARVGTMGLGLGSPSPHRGGAGLSFSNQMSPVSRGSSEQPFFPSAVSVADNVASPGPTPVTPASLRQPSTPGSSVRGSALFSTPLPQKQQQQASVWAQNTLATPGVSDQSSMQSSSMTAGSSSCWVTVFGFSPQNLNNVIESFLSCGQIVQHISQGNSNWVHLQFEAPVGAQRALSRNGSVIGGSTMIGVMKRREFGHAGPGMLFNTTTDASITGSARKSSRLVGNESLYLQQRNQYSVAPATAGDFSGAPRQQDSKISSFINYFFGY